MLVAHVSALGQPKRTQRLDAKETQRILRAARSGATEEQLIKRFHRSPCVIRRLVKAFRQNPGLAACATETRPVNAAQRLRLENSKRMRRYFERAFAGAFG